MTHTALHYAHKMPCTTHASMHSAPLRKKSDALRSSARSGYLMRRLRHAVSRPCDAFRAVLEPLLSCASYAADGAAATHPVLRRADRRRVEPTAPRLRRLGPPAGCGGCSVRGKRRRCLRVPHRCPCAFPRGRSTGLGVAGFAIRSRRGARDVPPRAWCLGRLSFAPGATADVKNGATSSAKGRHARWKEKK